MSHKNRKIIALILIFIIILSDSSEVLAKTNLSNGVTKVTSRLLSNFNIESIVKLNPTDEEEKKIKQITEMHNEEINNKPQLIIDNKDIPQINIKYVRNIDYETNIITWDSILDAEYEVEVDGNIIDVKEDIGYFHHGISQNSEHTYRVRAKKDGIVGPWSNEFVKEIPKN